MKKPAYYRKLDLLEKQKLKEVRKELRKVRKNGK